MFIGGIKKSLELILLTERQKILTRYQSSPGLAWNKETSLREFHYEAEIGVFVSMFT